MKHFLRNYKISVPVGAVVIAGLAWLAFGFFGVHLLFVNDEVDEAVPTLDAGAAPVVEASGAFVSGEHDTSGEAIVLGDGQDQRFLRLEDLDTSNGPDLNVYLVNSSTGDVSDYIDLGNLKGNIGNQNYELASDVDLSVYDRVVIWCVRFSVAFGDAVLAPT